MSGWPTRCELAREFLSLNPVGNWEHSDKIRLQFQPSLIGAFPTLVAVMGQVMNRAAAAGRTRAPPTSGPSSLPSVDLQAANIPGQQLPVCES